MRKQVGWEVGPERVHKVVYILGKADRNIYHLLQSPDLLSALPSFVPERFLILLIY